MPGIRRSCATASPRVGTRPAWWRDRRLRPIALAALTWAVAATLQLTAGPETLVTALYAAAILIGGAPFARAGWQAVRARRLDMNVLMTISAIGAAALGEWGEGAMVVVLFALGGTLQALTLDRTRGAIRALMALSPPEALVVCDGFEEVVPVAALAVGDRVRVRPGARIAADGRVVAGASAVDQSAITGESMPVDKAAGGEVFAGTVNGSGGLLIEVTRPAADSTLARIVHLVEEAQGSRAPSQQLVDRFAAFYTPAVIAGALALAAGGSSAQRRSTAVGLPGAGAARHRLPLRPGHLDPGRDRLGDRGGDAPGRPDQGRGGAGGGRGGAGRRLRQDRHVDAGTAGGDGRGSLTPSPLSPPRERGSREREVLALAAAVEAHSEHPIARAVVARARHEQVAIPVATDFQALPGRGARAFVDGWEVTVGSPRLGAEMGLVGGDPFGPDHRGDARQSRSDPSPTAREGANSAITRLAEAGRTPLLVAVADEPGAEPRLVGLIGVADAARPDAAAAVARLRAAGVPHVAVLTGDTPATGAAIAAAVGADEVRAELLPADKAAAVRELRDRYGPVVMVGDGVNDAPALAAADVGVAMGGRGTDVALETADIALMRDDLAGVATALTLSRRTTRVIRQNISLSLALKGVALALGALGFVDLWLAVAADMGTSLLVTANGMRLGIDGQSSSADKREAAPTVEPAPAVGS